MLKEGEKRCVLFKRIQCINETLVSAGRSDLLRTDSDSNPKSVKISISRTSLDWKQPKQLKCAYTQPIPHILSNSTLTLSNCLDWTYPI